MYDKAIAEGLWNDTYAGSNHHEYWAEGVQSYYDCNREKNWNHNHVNTRTELEAYDPDMAEFIAQTLAHTKESDWRYKPVAIQPQVTAVPGSLFCDSFFTKYVYCRGLPILGSDKVQDRAMLEANYLIRHIFAYRHDILKTMIDSNARFVVTAADENLSELPGYTKLDTTELLKKGSEGVLKMPEGFLIACNQNNLIKNKDDSHASAGILFGEMAKAVYAYTCFRPIDKEFENKPKQQYELRVIRMDIGFDDKIKKLYDAALKSGLWRDSAASSDRIAYWSEGVKAWFDCGDLNQNSDLPCTREQLQSYDHALASIVAEVFRHTFRDDPWRYTLPDKR